MKRMLGWLLLAFSAALLVWIVPRGWCYIRVQQALARMQSEEALEQAAGREDLVQIGAPAVPGLVTELGRVSCPIRTELAALVREIDGAQAVALLRPDLAHPEAARRAEAARLFGVLEMPETAPLLVSLLEDADPEVFRQAVVTLSFLDHRPVIPRFRELLVSGGATRRAWAAYGLGFMKDTESLGSLERALRMDRDPAVRYQSLHALQRLGAVPEGFEKTLESGTPPALDP